MHRVSDCIREGVRFAMPQPTEWQRIGDEIKAAFVFARADFVKVHKEAWTRQPQRWVKIIHLSLVRDTTLRAWLSAVAD